MVTLEKRPPLPSPLMREVRQRCGFGCVICGFPIFEYDHILGWAKVQRHVASEITLLCDNHHRAKTAGFLPNERVIQANKDPYCLQLGRTHPYNLFYSGDSFEIALGNCKISDNNAPPSTTADIVRIDGHPLLTIKLEDGHYLLSLNIYNSQGVLVFQVVENELILNVNLWDIELVGTRLILREASRNILFDITFLPPSTVLVKRGRFLCNGVELLVTPTWTAVLNSCNLISNVHVENMTAHARHYAALLIGDTRPDDPFAVIHVGNVPRDGWDRAAAIKWAQDKESESEDRRKLIKQLLEAQTL